MSIHKPKKFSKQQTHGNDIRKFYKFFCFHYNEPKFILMDFNAKMSTCKELNNSTLEVQIFACYRM